MLGVRHQTDLVASCLPTGPRWQALVTSGGFPCAKVVFGDVLDVEGKALAAELGTSVRYVHLDVTDLSHWEGAVQTAESEFGPVTLLVNNAGIVAFGGIDSMTPEEFRRVIDINLTGTWLGMHTTVGSLKKSKGGAIINISSTAGLMGYALELGPSGIRVMSIHPGPISTPMTAGMGDGMTASQPIARWGTVDEVTRLMLFMASEATYSTGSEWVIDGGAVLGPIQELG
ncbi:MAG: SDR family oxidoreductase [Chloroflexi bacterium]|nr:SDR family oxidoreductase [Chloroflexota bacterium]